MHEYDVALKLLLQASADSVLRQITGEVHIIRWLNVELPEVRTRRADLLGETADGQLFQLEVQSSNDADMPLRMAEYSLAVYRHFRRFPKQILLYVGEARLRMARSLMGPDPANPEFAFRYTLVDVRDLDGNALLQSAQIEANVFAILTRLQDQIATVREILSRMAQLGEAARRDMLAKFLIISGLRRLNPVIKEEANKMPITASLVDDALFGPMILKGRHEGREELLKKQLNSRFGPVPNWVNEKLKALSASELDDLAVRLLDATRLEDILQP